VTPGFRDPWQNRGEKTRGDREEPRGGENRSRANSLVFMPSETFIAQGSGSTV